MEVSVSVTIRRGSEEISLTDTGEVQVSSRPSIVLSREEHDSFPCRVRGGGTQIKSIHKEDRQKKCENIPAFG